MSSEEQARLQMQQLQQNNIVYFDLDKYDIRSDFAQMLDAHANFLRSNPSYKVTVEGHADERGTPEYSVSQSTFAGHFVEVGVHSATGEVRVRHMLAVCAAGRILNPKTARSQVIGAMTMGMGAALMEELAVDDRLGYFVNHDMAIYKTTLLQPVFQRQRGRDEIDITHLRVTIA